MEIQVGGHYRDRTGALLRCMQVARFQKNIDYCLESFYVCYVIGPVYRNHPHKRYFYSDGKYFVGLVHQYDLVEEIQ